MNESLRARRISCGTNGKDEKGGDEWGVGKVDIN
jgi:hypothetical protein